MLKILACDLLGITDLSDQIPYVFYGCYNTTIFDIFSDPVTPLYPESPFQRNRPHPSLYLLPRTGQLACVFYFVALR